MRKPSLLIRIWDWQGLFGMVTVEMALRYANAAMPQMPDASTKTVLGEMPKLKEGKISID
jgi:hypothetical protein